MLPNPYLDAYDAALADLTRISEQFEQLRTRKGQVENLVTVLQSVFASAQHMGPELVANEATPNSHEAEEISSQNSEVAAEESMEPARYSFLDVPVPLPDDTAGDPFQRRGKATFRFRGLSAQR